jgi:hypothetical protein
MGGAGRTAAAQSSQAQQIGKFCFYVATDKKLLLTKWEKCLAKSHYEFLREEKVFLRQPFWPPERKPSRSQNYCFSAIVS